MSLDAADTLNELPDAIDPFAPLGAEIGDMSLAGARRVRSAIPELNGGKTEIAFVDGTVADYQTLVADMRPGVEVVVVSGPNALEQIAAYLEGSSNVQAIHLISHGGTGVFTFGGENLSAGTIETHQATLASIGSSLAPDGDLLLYGCDVGAGAAGEALVSKFAAYTKADVAASTDLTGAAARGGDWDLELHVGTIDVATAVNAVSGSNYDLALKTYTFTDETFFYSVFGSKFSHDYQDLTITETDNHFSAPFISIGINIDLPGWDELVVVGTETEFKKKDGSLFDANHFYVNSALGGNITIKGIDAGGNIIAARDVWLVSLSDTLVELSGFTGIARLSIDHDNNSSGYDQLLFSNLVLDETFIPPMPDPPQPPTVISSGGPTVALEQTPTFVDAGLIVSGEGPAPVSARVYDTGGFQPGEDLLALGVTSGIGDITASYATGILTLTSGGFSTMEQWQTALRSVTYTNTSDTPYIGNHSFTFSVFDGTFTMEASLMLMVQAVNDAPAGTPTAPLADGTEDTPYTISAADLLTGFTDPEGGTLSVAELSASNGGALKDNGNGTWTFTPDLNFSGDVILTYTVSDGQGGTLAKQTLGFAITPVNDAPVGAPISLAGGVEDTPYTISAADLLAGFTDIEGDMLSVAEITNSSGTLNDNKDGTWTFIPAADYNGTVTLTYTVSDGKGGILAGQTQSLVIAPVNDDPAGAPSAILADGAQDTPYTFLTADLLAGFTDADGDNLSVIGLGASAGGSLNDNGNGTWTFTPDAGFSGNVTLFYEVSDGHGGILAKQTQSFAITPPNSAPTGAPTAILADGTEDIVYTISAGDLLSGFEDPDGDKLSVIGLSANNGSFKDNGDGTWSFIPDANFDGIADDNFNGSVNLTYTVTDGKGGELANQTLGFTIAPANDAPTGAPTAILSDGVAGTTYTISATDLLAGFEDPEGDTLSVTGVSVSGGGTLTPNKNGTWTFEPAAGFTGDVTLLYSVSDGQGGVLDKQTQSFAINPLIHAPVVTGADGNVTATEQVAALVFADVSVSDADSATLLSAKVVITGGFQKGQDVLALGTNVGIGDIMAKYDADTGALFLTSEKNTATMAQWNEALRSVTYTNTSDTPDAAQRSIIFSVSDGASSSDGPTRTVTVGAVNDAPVVITTKNDTAAIEQTPTIVDGGVIVSDVDSKTLAFVEVRITKGFQPGEDMLGLGATSGIGNITASYDGKGQLVLASAGATATLAEWQVALRAVTYTNTSDTPDLTPRTLTFMANDGASSSGMTQKVVTVTGASEAPIVTTTGGATTAIEQTASIVDAGLILSDKDSATFVSATVAITGGFFGGQDVLALGATSGIGDITATYDAAVGRLFLTSAGGSATVAEWQAALRSVTYTNTFNAPITMARTVTFTVNDGTNSSVGATHQVTVQAVNDATVVSTTTGATAAIEQVASIVDGGLILSDVDNKTLLNATVSISGGLKDGEDVLALLPNPGIGDITAIQTGPGKLLLTSTSGTVTMAQWQAALRAVTYTNTSNTPDTTTRTVTFTVNDGTDSTSATHTVTVKAVNDAPLITLTGGVTPTLEQAAVNVDAGLAIFDRDSTTLVSATVAIVGNFRAGEDVLALGATSGIGNITAKYDAKGQLFLTSADGSATMAQWQTALRAVTYTNTSDTPDTTPRALAFTLNDGAASSTSMVRTVIVTPINDAPVVTATKDATAAIEQTATIVDAGLIVSDKDSATFVSATVSITGGFHGGQDVLALGATSGIGDITAKYAAGTGQLFLNSSGSATAAEWQAALRSVTYTNTSDTPDTATRAVTFTVNDGPTSSSSATHQVTVQAVNDAPFGTLIGTLADGLEDTAYTISAANLLSGFKDPDGDKLSVTGLSASAGGTLKDNGDGTWTFIPKANFSGSVNLTYTVSDGHGGTLAGQIRSFAITPVNDAPTGKPTGSLADGLEGNAYTISAADLLAGFKDVDGDTLSVTGLTASAGALKDNGDGTWTFTLDASFSGDITLTYGVSDGWGATLAGQTRSFAIVPVNEAPTGAPTVTLADGTEDTAYTISAADLLAGFKDPDGDNLLVTGLSTSAGTLKDNGNGTWTFTPAANFNGDITLTYGVSDGHGGTLSSQTRSFAIAPVNDAPTGKPTGSLDDGLEGTAYTISAADLLAGFKDADGDTLSVTGLTASAGALKDNGDGTWTFTPASGFSGDITLTYGVSDGQGGTLSGQTRSFAIAPDNDAPTGKPTGNLDDGLEDTAYTISAADLLAGFKDADGDTLSVTRLTASAGALKDNGDGTWTFTPASGFSGDITLTYGVSDGQGGTLSGQTRSFAIAPVNDAPTGKPTGSLDDGFEDTAYTISAADLLAGFKDPDGDKLSVTGLTASAGALKDNGDGTWTFTPAANFNGDITLTYGVSDGHGGILAGQTRSFAIVPDNGAPTGTPTASLDDGLEDTAYTISAADLLAGFKDADGGTLSVAGLSASVGALKDNGDGTWTFTPADNFNGPVTLTYGVSDGQGATLAGQTRSFAIVPDNDAPTGAPTASLADGLEDTAHTISAADLLAGFEDPDGGTLSVTGLSASAGALKDNGDGTWTFTPDASFSGDITLTYGVSDGQGGTLSGQTRSFAIVPANDAPTGAPTASLADGLEDTAYTISAADLLVGFSDPEGDTLSVTGLSASAGTLKDNGDGTWTFTPAANFSGDIVLTYGVSDGEGGTLAGQTRSFAIAPASAPPQAPVAVNDTFTTSQGQAVTVQVLANDHDPDANPLTITMVNDQAIAIGSPVTLADGTVELLDDGRLRFTPHGVFEGAVLFTYTISDGTGGTATTVVTGTVSGPAGENPGGGDPQEPNAAPLAHSDVLTLHADGRPVLLDVIANDSDPEGAPLRITAIDGHAISAGSAVDVDGGRVTLSADGTLLFTPAEDHAGSVTFSYTVADPAGGTASTLVTSSTVLADLIPQIEDVLENHGGAIKDPAALLPIISVILPDALAGSDNTDGPGGGYVPPAGFDFDEDSLPAGTKGLLDKLVTIALGLDTDGTELVTDDGSGEWTSASYQSLAIQSVSGASRNITFEVGGSATSFDSGVASDHAWSRAFAQKVLRSDFDASGVVAYDGSGQGAARQSDMDSGASLAVKIDGQKTGTPHVALSSPFGLADFVAVDGDSAVEVSRLVTAAHTLGDADDQQAVIRMRQNGVQDVEVMFYKVDDYSGMVDGLRPGDAGYDAASRLHAYKTDLGATSISGAGYGAYGEARLTGVDGGDLIAMRLASGGRDFYMFANANEKMDGEGVNHVWNYGLNTWGWEDLYGGGDRDFNDLVVQMDFVSAALPDALL